ncbi:MAG: polysulfide reductase NrfD [Deltaproteobacteria bacterium]|nr:polysulfide reductase NrfD [Deltaproteobacteria bacterium]
MIEKALTGGKNYWLWLAFLSSLTFLGLLSYLKQLEVGLGITGMSRNVSWGLYIANFTFFVGVAASAVMLVIPYYLHGKNEYSRIMIFAEFLAVVSVFVALLFVLVDLGRPDRLFNVILFPSPKSLLFWDMLVLTGYLILNLILGWKACEAEKREIEQPYWTKILVYISIPWAISIHTVTAFIYCGLSARPFWFSALLAPRFLATAFVSGPAILLIFCLALKRFAGFDPGQNALENLRKTVTYALSVHIFFFLVEFFTVFYSDHPEHVKPFRYMLFGYEGHYHLVAFSWISLFVAVFSFFILMSGNFLYKRKLAFFILTMLIFGIWLDKGLILMVAGFNPTPEVELEKYMPTFPETIITIGIWSLGTLTLSLLTNIALQIKKSI